MSALLWSPQTLAELRRIRQEGADLIEAAGVMGVAPAACNRALDALLGRTPEEAAAALSQHLPAPVSGGGVKPRHRLRRFLDGLFGGDE